MQTYITEQDCIQYLNKTRLASTYNYFDMKPDIYTGFEEEADNVSSEYMPNYFPIFSFPRMESAKSFYLEILSVHDKKIF